MVTHICNPSTWEGEAGRLQVQNQPELHSKSQSQKKQNTKILTNKTKGSTIKDEII
jgi:hypothetical protein